jgi:hypothetical protein
MLTGRSNVVKYLSGWCCYVYIFNREQLWMISYSLSANIHVILIFVYREEAAQLQRVRSCSSRLLNSVGVM